MSTNDKLAPGTVLGRYELLLPIAQGGMATVWAARQKGSRGFQKTVAIKTMLPALTDDAQFEQMFLDEAALAARIHHPNVVEILDLGEQDEVLYLVMEWVDGEALSVVHKASRKSNVQLPQRIALKILAQACSGLHAAHELKEEDADEPLGLVHRDVSPQNILVTYDGVVKLVDFGVAKAMNRAGGETTAGQLKGKVPYMSPEQARGGKVDRRTDIFAMGIVLYKLTTGIHPFMGDTDLVTMRNIISRPLLPPRLKNPHFSIEIEHVIMKALQKDPDKRYETIFELGQAIERANASIGGGDDDVGGFVRLLMGERGGKRRAAIRDAARAADERVITGEHPAPGPVVHEHVSDIVLTKMSSGVNNDMVPEHPSQSSSATGLVHTTTQPAPSQADLELPVELPIERRGRSSMFVILAGVAAAIAAVVAVVATSGGHAPASAGTAEPAAARVTAAAPTVAAQAPPAAPEPTPSATTTGMSIDDLPNVEEPAPAAARGGARGWPGARTSKEPKEPKEAPTSAASAKTPKTVSTQWVPSVQSPGF